MEDESGQKPNEGAKRPRAGDEGRAADGAEPQESLPAKKGKKEGAPAGARQIKKQNKARLQLLNKRYIARCVGWTDLAVFGLGPVPGGPATRRASPPRTRTRTARRISDFAQRKQLSKALAAFDQIAHEGLAPSVYSFTNVINAHVRSGCAPGRQRARRHAFCPPPR